MVHRHGSVVRALFVLVLGSCGNTSTDPNAGVSDAASDGGAAGQAGAAGVPGAGGWLEIPYPCPSGPVVAPVPDIPCAIVDPGSFGDCAMPLGVGFTGSSCVPVSGCSAPVGTLFDSIAACAVTCAAAGQCDPGDFGSKASVDHHCDDIIIRLPVFDESMLASLCSIAPEIRCYQQPDKPVECKVNTEHGAGLTAEQVLDICAFGLVPDVDQLSCMVYL